MNIYLADLEYIDPNSYSHTVPLNVGYITVYLKIKFPGISVRIFKNPIDLMENIKTNPPQVLALSHYFWNSNLDLAVISQAKKVSPKTITVMGGINFQQNNKEWVKKFLSNRPALDLYLTGEGESCFLRLIELLTAHSLEFSKIPFSDWPANFFAFDHAKGEVLNNPANILPALDLSKLPSPYLAGVLDEFLNDPHYSPIIETNRGCPFTCTYCCLGDKMHNKTRFFPMETVIEEIIYIAQHSKNLRKHLYICDTNFGMFARDRDISEVIKNCDESYGFPKEVSLYFAKNATEKVIEIAKIIRNQIAGMSLSMQSLDPEVLKNINRKNIVTQQYEDLYHKCQTEGIYAYCELIFGLPGESYDSFIKGAIQIARMGQPLVTYSLLTINGASISSPETRSKYNIKTAFRVNPYRIMSSGDIHSVDYDEIVVSTKDFSLDDFFKARLFQFLLFVLKQTAFKELRHWLMLMGSDYASLARFIVEVDSERSITWENFLNCYKKAARKKLLSESEIKLTFTSRDIEEIKENVVHLNIYYLAQLLSSGELILNFRQAIVRYFVSENIKSEGLEEIIEFSFDKLINYEQLKNVKIISYEYDVDKWLSCEPARPLEEFRESAAIFYEFSIEEDVFHSLKENIKSASTIAQAVSNVRISRLGALGDKVYCYQRTMLNAKNNKPIQC